MSVKSPSGFAHFVLQTPQFEKVSDFYHRFLGGKIAWKSDHMSFITYDHEHHRIAVVRNDQLKPKDAKTAGLVHVAYTYETLQGLCLAYKQRKAMGIEPVWCVNHGPTISFYYVDPDGNQIETQVDAMEPDAATAFMNSSEFDRNSVGADLDPEEFMKRVESGEPTESLVKRPDVGPRGPDDIKALQEKFVSAAVTSMA